MIDLSHIRFAEEQQGLAHVLSPALSRIPQTVPRPTAHATGWRDEVCFLDPFVGWLLRLSGLDARIYRPRSLQRRLPACLRALRAASVNEGQTILRDNPHLLPLAISSLLIGVTEFFRDEGVFEIIQRRVIPRLFETRPRLRVCSAGCSDGQELYSLAMLLHEIGRLRDCDLLGVDCRAEAISQAAEGRFSAKNLGQVSRERRQKFFSAAADGLTVIPSLRRAIRWDQADMTVWQTGTWDLILFRNVSIYLQTQAAADLWKRLTDALSPGGVLVTGKAECPPESLPLRRISACLYEKFREEKSL